MVPSMQRCSGKVFGGVGDNMAIIKITAFWFQVCASISFLKLSLSAVTKARPPATGLTLNRGYRNVITSSHVPIYIIPPTVGAGDMGTGFLGRRLNGSLPKVLRRGVWLLV